MCYRTCGLVVLHGMDDTLVYGLISFYEGIVVTVCIGKLENKTIKMFLVPLSVDRELASD